MIYTLKIRIDTRFIKGNPNLTDMINGNRLDEYILYLLVLWDKKTLNNLKDREAHHQSKLKGIQIKPPKGI